MPNDEEREIFADGDGPVYDWQHACLEALRERDPAKIPERVRQADMAIQSRLSRLEPWPDGQEMAALNEAVQGLRWLRTKFMN